MGGWSEHYLKIYVVSINLEQYFNRWQYSETENTLKLLIRKKNLTSSIHSFTGSLLLHFLLDPIIPFFKNWCKIKTLTLFKLRNIE